MDFLSLLYYVEPKLVQVEQGFNSLWIIPIIIWAVVLLFVYFIPAFIAYSKKHDNKTAIILLNIFLGWTLIGWVVSLVWAVKKPPVYQVNNYTVTNIQSVPDSTQSVESDNEDNKQG